LNDCSNWIILLTLMLHGSGLTFFNVIAVHHKNYKDEVIHTIPCLLDLLPLNTLQALWRLFCGAVCCFSTIDFGL